ncbi:MAG: hypothetical protein JWR03_1313, partial [Cohnella sp.]|nr:hypothetical protein [Cohnella sp.]
DAMLDTGLVGLMLFLTMLGLLVWKVWKARRQALAPASVLLVHAAVDFDWSYGWMWLLLFAWLALSAESGDGGRAAGARLDAGWRRAGGRVAAVLLLGASAWSGWAAWHSLAAVRYSSAADTAATPAAREAELRAALEANPAWNRIRMALAPLLPQAGERQSVLAAGLRYEPQSAPLMLQLGLAEAELGHVAQAQERLREALRLERFSRDGHTAAIAAMSRMAESLDFAGRPEDARKAAAAAAALFERYRQLVREVDAMDHPANGKRFALTASAVFNAAQAYDRLGRADQARPLLQLLIQGKDESWKEQAQQLLDKIDLPVK